VPLQWRDCAVEARSGWSNVAGGVPIMDSARETCPVKRAGILDELLADGSLVLYDAARREVITLNPLAAYVWECCTGDRDVRTIIAEARDLFPDVPHVEADVLAFLDNLRRANLIAPPMPDHANR
jgi:hypothetical protein